MTTIKSSVSGTVVKILVQPGDQINEGDEILIIESMKMEIPLESEEEGVVLELLVAEGDAVTEDQDLVKLK